MYKYVFTIYIYPFFSYMMYIHIFSEPVRRRQTTEDDMSRMRGKGSRYVRISRTMQKIGTFFAITLRIVYLGQT